jgi:hypothetical protein
LFFLTDIVAYPISKSNGFRCEKAKEEFTLLTGAETYDIIYLTIRLNVK